MTGRGRWGHGEGVGRFDLRHVTIHGHSVGFRRAGKGEAIVLIHGLAGSSRTWKDVMPELARRYDVIAPDLLGHGQSAKPLGDYSLGAHASGLRDLLAMLDVPQASIVGHSLGGGVAMQLAYQHPERCDRLVLIGSGGLGREVSWLLRMLTLPGAEQLMPLAFPRWFADRGSDASRFLRNRGVSAPRLGEMWRAYTSLAGAENRRAFLRTVRTVIDLGGQTISAHDRLYLAAHIPTLIVWGEQDAIIPVAHAYTAHEAIVGSRLEVLPGVGHFPHTESPDRLVAILLDFFESTVGAARSAETLHDVLRAGPRVAPGSVPGGRTKEVVA